MTDNNKDEFRTTCNPKPEPGKFHHVFPADLYGDCQCGLIKALHTPEEQELVDQYVEPPLSDAPQATAGREQYKYDQVQAFAAIQAIQTGEWDRWLNRIMKVSSARFRSVEYGEWLMNLFVGQQESGK